MSNGDGGGFNIGDFFSGLGDLLSGLLSEILAVLEFIWNVLVAVATFLYDALQTLGKFVLAHVRAIGAAINYVWDVVFRKVLVPLIEFVARIAADVKRFLGPVISFIQRIRDWYFKHIFPIQHAILEVLAVLRTITELFRLLGAKWAAKLDADLQKIQAYITTSIVDVVSTLNKISTILGLIVHPDMLIRRDAFGRSLWDSLKQLKQAVGFGSARPVYPDEQQQIDKRKALVLSPAPMYHTNADGSVEMDPTLKELDGRLDQAARTLGIGP